MKWAILVLAGMHGAIHAMGFANVLGIKKMGAFSGSTTIALSEPIRRGLGLAWLSAGGGLLVAAAGLAMSADWWKPVLVSGTVLSQILIVIWWKDAWAGTIANLLLLLGLVLIKG